MRLNLESLGERIVPTAATGRVLVTFQTATPTVADVAQLASAPITSHVSALGLGSYRVDLDPGISTSQAITTFSGLPGVWNVSPDNSISAKKISSDPLVTNQWALTKISAATGWNTTTGTGNTIVAVIDSGVDYTNPDLAANMWRNPDAKAPDRFGYDFVNNDADPMDDAGHGTHVAGILGAIGDNNIGGSGVAWHTRIMALKFLDANGSGFTSDAVRSIDYAISHGAKIINASWGGPGSDVTLSSAVDRARAAGVIVVTAAGNDGTNNDNSGFYPASLSRRSDNIIAVAATDSSDRLASFSNFGAQTVLIAAPGVDITSTAPAGGQATMSGSSTAAPFVSGAIALLWDRNPTWTYRQIIDKLKTAVDVLPELQGKVSSGGRINLGKLLAVPPVVPPPAPPVVPPPAPTPAIRWTGSGPRVTAAQFLGSITDSFDRVRLTFDKRISVSTFTVSDVLSLTGPTGKLIVKSVVVVPGSNNARFDVTFAAQSAAGTYAIVLAADIWDTTAQRMDQNANGINGEAIADRYTASATLTTATSKKVVPKASVAPPKEESIADHNLRLASLLGWSAPLRTLRS